MLAKFSTESMIGFKFVAVLDLIKDSLNLNLPFYFFSKIFVFSRSKIKVTERCVIFALEKYSGRL